MIKIYDYNEVQKNSYFLCDGFQVVLVDFDQKTINVSTTGLKVFFILSRYRCKQIRNDSASYRQVLDRYHSMLADLVLPYKYERGSISGYFNTS